MPATSISNGDMSTDDLDDCRAHLLFSCEDAPPKKSAGTSLLYTSVLLAASGIGSGMLTLPNAVQECGPRMAILILLVGCAINVASTSLLLLGSSRLRADTYGLVVDRAYTPLMLPGGMPLTDTLLCVYLLLCTVSCFSFLGDFVSSLAILLPGMAWCGKGVSIAASALIVALLGVNNKMSVVSSLAGCSMFAILFTAAVVVGEGVTRIASRGSAVSEAWASDTELSWKTLEACGNFIFAFAIGSNVPSIACEMDQPTPVRSFLAASFACAIMLTFYTVLSLVCFFSFVVVESDKFSSVSPDFLNSYGERDPWMIASRALLSVSMLSVTALTLIPFMKSFYEVFAKIQGLENPEPPFRTRLLLISVLTGVCAVSAFLLQNIGVYVSWLGAFFGGPEVLLGPWVLLISGVCGDVGFAGKAAISIVFGCLLVLLWSAAIADIIIG